MGVIDTETYIEIEDVITIVGAAIFTSFLSEGFSYLMIYRKPDYKQIIGDVKGL